jgi:predicted double-glycine peptidase
MGFRFLLLLMLILAFKYTDYQLFAETVVPLKIGINGGNLSKKVNSWVEQRDFLVVKQAYDYSCGSAALATLINMVYNEDLSEGDVINYLLKKKSDYEIDDISKNGYSMLDLKNAVIDMGYNAAIYKIIEDKYEYIITPVIIYYEPSGQKHFAVLKKILNNKAYIADPSRGNIRIDMIQFKKQWKGLIMVIKK